MNYLNSREIKDNELQKKSKILWKEYSTILLSMKYLKDFTRIDRIEELHKILYGANINLKDVVGGK